MLASPWDLILTAVFVCTGLACLADLAARRGARSARGDGIGDEELIGIAHGVMSAAMILMLWVAVLDAVTWTQIALFAILALALALGIPRAHGAARRADLSGHILLSAAMIWMLAAMPLLMAGAGAAGGSGAGGTAHHHGGGGGGPGATPAWAEAVNLLFIALCAACALWWLYRLAAARGHRRHSASHALMAAGMGAMLWLMNA